MNLFSVFLVLLDSLLLVFMSFYLCLWLVRKAVDSSMASAGAHPQSLLSLEGVGVQREGGGRAEAGQVLAGQQACQQAAFHQADQLHAAPPPVRHHHLHRATRIHSRMNTLTPLSLL